MRKVHRVGFALVIAAALCLICRDGHHSAIAADKAPPAKVDAGPAEPGVIKGTATTADGAPIKAFGGSISGFSTLSGQRLTAGIDGADGKFRTEVGPGQFAGRAWADVEYNGRKYRIDLHPADDKGGLTKQDAKPGIVKNFVWRLDGFRPGADARSEDRTYAHYGASINLNPEGRGVEYWSGIKRDYAHKPEPKIDEHATVELTLTPDGPLIDGSKGKPVVLSLKPAKIKGYMDRIFRGQIPIGRYKATARAIAADGSARALKVTPYYQSKREDAPAPAESAVIEFVQSSAASDTINAVDEIVVHVMY